MGQLESMLKNLWRPGAENKKKAMQQPPSLARRQILCWRQYINGLMCRVVTL